jgi:S1-C subfamily serine protease
LFAGAAALAAAFLLQGANAAPASAIPGIVDIYTNLGYQSAEAAGTGIVLTGTGEVLTNNHVIRGATTVKAVDLDNGKTYKAKVLGYTVSNDIAIIQLQNASGLRTASIGNSTAARVGDSVTTLGNAEGQGGAPSATGKIVGLNRSITANGDGTSERLTGLIETNAPLQPGDSGGPMVNASGQVIGMDTAAGTTFTFAGSTSRGFAIPINHATSVGAQIVAGRKSTSIHIGPTAFIGVGLANGYFGQPTSGLTVGNVVPGSPSSKAGLATADVITKFDGQAVDSPTKLSALILAKAPGDTVQISWVDQSGTPHSASVQLAVGPPQ